MTVNPWPVEREFANVLRFPERPIPELDQLLAARKAGHRRPARTRFGGWLRSRDVAHVAAVIYLAAGIGVWIHFLVS